MLKATVLTNKNYFKIVTYEILIHFCDTRNVYTNIVLNLILNTLFCSIQMHRVLSSDDKYN